MRSRRFAIAGIIATLSCTTSAWAQSDAMSAYRDRFKEGLAKYQAGAVAEAIAYWEPIYRELGPQKAWRLAFNLARAYESVGDATRAVERYESFLAEVDRRESSEMLEELIIRERQEAKEHLAEIAATKGRIVVAAGSVPVKIDATEPRLGGFTAYVAPGKHVIVFAPGAERESTQEVDVEAGKAIDVAAPPEPERAPVEPVAPPRRVIRIDRTMEHPFPSIVLWAGGGLALVTTLIPILTLRAAYEDRTNPDNKLRFVNGIPDADHNQSVREQNDAKASTYYATLAIPIGAAAITGGLAVWYVLGAKVRETPVFGVLPGGGYAGVQRTF